MKEKSVSFKNKENVVNLQKGNFFAENDRDQYGVTCENRISGKNLVIKIFELEVDLMNDPGWSFSSMCSPYVIV